MLAMRIPGLAAPPVSLARCWQMQHRRSRQCLARAEAENGDTGAQRKLDGLVDGQQGQEAANNWANPLSAGQIIGSYLPVATWTVILVGAAFLGFKKAQTAPEEVGMLIAPSAAAGLLIVSFLVYRFTVGKADYDE